MSAIQACFLVAATCIFVAAGTASKAWVVSSDGRYLLVATLALYTLGNLVMLRLVRDLGLGIAVSLSSVTQLLALNLIAIGYFGETLTWTQTIGIVLAVIAVALISLGG